MELQTRVLTFSHPCSFQTAVRSELNSAGIDVEEVASMGDCLRWSRFGAYQGILIDADLLNFEDAILLVRVLRQENPYAALFAVAKYLDLEQRLRLFQGGVDDCPCGLLFAPELKARFVLSMRLHQAGACLATVLRAGGVELDLVRRRAARSGRPLDLRHKEFLLLECLMRNANRPVTRAMILEQVWGPSTEGLEHVVGVYISALRSKLDSGFVKKLIRTNVGIGYTFACIDSSKGTA